ncbi:hypothetical protein B0H12DRAFT_1242344 [Mycena haematopus]|nr:hypothetical protein B0H12DRAFT_1242344 [Mycena haematopus]
MGMDAAWGGRSPAALLAHEEGATLYPSIGRTRSSRAFGTGTSPPTSTATKRRGLEQQGAHRQHGRQLLRIPSPPLAEYTPSLPCLEHGFVYGFTDGSYFSPVMHNPSLAPYTQDTSPGHCERGDEHAESNTRGTWRRGRVSVRSTRARRCSAPERAFASPAPTRSNDPDSELREEVHVCIASGGPAGLSATICFKKLEAETSLAVRVMVLKKHAKIGSHILSGTDIEPSALDALLLA